ncbi:CALCIUM-BINDING EF-HAND FAMILY PROTEIN-LIKE [Salix koriyanagi]|uniref:CALCIUM-BINDING EF-HAND FAMILY PROTEIN-LIKE n=1 Tax=Salix koriyanagi TaxID=2511006 RepID=A0A9Q0U5L9_9ROSI|nr:CALCIUM-BINDING EF-HAND FAMILY PROTEIN-LIKE [Salix koriyanagi]
MSVEILDGATIVNFLEDEEAFNVSVRDRFAHLDSNHDGQLSYEEMLKELQGLRVMETHFGVDVETDRDELVRVYDSLFVQFDHDLNGTVDLEEFKAETRQMMLAGHGERDGFLACADGAGRRQFLEESCGVGIC